MRHRFLCVYRCKSARTVAWVGRYLSYNSPDVTHTHPVPLHHRRMPSLPPLISLPPPSDVLDTPSTAELGGISAQSTAQTSLSWSRSVPRQVEEGLARSQSLMVLRRRQADQSDCWTAVLSKMYCTLTHQRKNWQTVSRHFCKPDSTPIQHAPGCWQRAALLCCTDCATKEHRSAVAAVECLSQDRGCQTR